jgi:hypothetical protein
MENEPITPGEIEIADWDRLGDRYAGRANFIPSDTQDSPRPVLFVRLDETAPAARIGAALDWAVENAGSQTIYLLKPAESSKRVEATIAFMLNVIKRLGSKRTGLKDAFGGRRPVAVWVIDPVTDSKRQLTD